MEDKAVYEVDLNKKYILRVPRGISRQELEYIHKCIRDWMQSKEPFLIVSDAVTLVRVEEADETHHPS